MAQITDTKLVVRVEVTGDVTSFRYPHFTQGIHPTFEMPPPSTIYGLMAATIGDLFNPMGWLFGYYFTHEGKFVDYKEHLHYSDPIQPMPINRELLFKPKLTLYLAHPNEDYESLIHAFRSPYYTLSLGRSQDLVCVRNALITTLARVERGIFDRTLLPLSMAPRLNQSSVALTLAQHIDERRHVKWNSYCALTDATVYPPRYEPSEYDNDFTVLEFEEGIHELWADNQFTYPRYDNLSRLIWFHPFTES